MNTPKYSPEESLERIKLVMKYDMSKTATENGLYEQTQSKGIDFKYNFPNDSKYVYGVKGKEWYAKNIDNGKIFNLTKDGYTSSVNKLNTQFPDAIRQSGTQTNIIKKPIQQSVKPSLNTKNSFFLQNQQIVNKTSSIPKQGIIPSVIPGIKKVSGNSISDALLKAREFFFTPAGMTSQLVLSILGSEIGVPVVFTTLDVAILINDFTIMINNWKPYDGDTTEENWFMYHWNNNKGFQMVMEDLLLLSTGAIINLAGKGAKSAYRTFIGKSGEGVFKTVEKVSQKIINESSKIKKLPKPIAKWAENKVGRLKQGIDLLLPSSSKSNRVIRKVPVATAIAIPNYMLMKYLDNKSREWTKYKLPNDFNEDIKSIETLKKGLTEYNPDIKIKTLKILTDKEGCHSTFIINGRPYIFDPKTDDYKIIPVK